MKTPLTVKCPTCHAAAGQACRTYGMAFCLDRIRRANPVTIRTYHSNALGRVTIPQ